MLQIITRPCKNAASWALVTFAKTAMACLMIPFDYYYHHYVPKDENSLTLDEWRFRTCAFLFTYHLPIMWLNSFAPPVLKRWVMRFMGTLHDFKCFVPCTFQKRDGFAGWWYTNEKLASPASDIKDNTTIIFHAHGGGYCAGNPRQYPSIFSHWVKNAAANGHDTRIFSLQYTLLEVQSGRPDHSQKVATQICIDEALAAYDYMTQTMKIDSSRIVLSGDSAGGNLMFATALNIRDSNRPKPAGVLLVSPWVEIDCTHWRSDEDSRDWFNTYLAQTMFDWYNKHYPELHTHPYISPTHAKLKGLPPLYVWYGGQEMMAESIEEFCRKAKQADVLSQGVCDKRLYHVAPFIADWIGPASQKHLDNIIRWTEDVVDSKH